MQSRSLFIAFLLFFAAGPARPADADTAGSAPDLAALSIEQLTQVEVTSVGRKDQNLSQVAAAVFVITAEDIRRSGVANVPELLRMVPGIQVAQIAANIWAISSRGFNGRGANKMLVMVDGRSIYNTLFSGTFWDQNQVPLDQIERIEVTRGAGATMWGSNAVDGVISIVTKKAKDTKGTLLTAEAGNTNLPDTGIRFGGQAGDRLQYRLDAGFGEHPGLLTQNGNTAPDRWNSGHGGFRLDWQASDRDTLSFEGSAYQGGGNETVNVLFPLPAVLSAVDPFSFSGGSVTGRWEHKFKGSDIAFEAYYSRESRAEVAAHGSLNTTDFDFQHHVPLGRRNDFIWGVGYRWRGDNSVGVSQHDDFDESLFSSFAQDEITLVPDRLTLTAGARIQDYRNTVGNNFDFQPQVRLLWALSKRRSLWGAVSRPYVLRLRSIATSTFSLIGPRWVV
jgi:iron complex outermembrane receptor protein